MLSDDDEEALLEALTSFQVRLLDAVGRLEHPLLRGMINPEARTDGRIFGTRSPAAQLIADLAVFADRDEGSVGDEAHSSDLMRLLEHETHWLVLGPAGSGKSVLAHALVLWLSEDDALRVPIHTSTVELMRSELHPHELAEKKLGAAIGRVKARGLARTLEARAAQGRCVLILDGLDELPRRHRAGFLARLATWCTQAPRMFVFLFARPSAHQWVPEWFRRARVLPLAVKVPGSGHEEPTLGTVDGDQNKRRRLRSRWARGGQVMKDVASVPPWFIDELDSPVLVRALETAGKDKSNPTRADVYGDAVDRLLAARSTLSEAEVARQLVKDILLESEDEEIESGAWWHARLADATNARASHDFGHTKRVWADSWQTLTRDSGLLTTNDDPASQHARWRFAHGFTRPRLLAEALAESGLDAIVQRAAQAEAPSPTGVWTQVIGMACTLTGQPLRAIEAVRSEAPCLAVAALPEVAELRAPDILAFLMNFDRLTVRIDSHGASIPVDIWNGDTLLRLARTVDGFEPLLWSQVANDLKMDHAAYLFYALDQLDSQRARARFFEQGGYRPQGDPGDVRFCTVKSDRRCTLGSPAEEIDHHWRNRDELFKREDIDKRERWGQVVVLNADFHMARTTVTNSAFRRFADDHPPTADPQVPVTEVTWWRAYLYAAWAGCTLPTEKQWEYACRAGTRTAWWCGDDESQLAKIAVYGLDRAHNGPRSWSPGERETNPFGLADMHGNVWEWCVSPWSEPLTSGTTVPGRRAARGGSYSEDPSWIRSASRSKGPPALATNELGFRLVKIPETNSSEEAR